MVYSAPNQSVFKYSLPGYDLTFTVPMSEMTLYENDPGVPTIPIQSGGDRGKIAYIDKTALLRYLITHIDDRGDIILPKTESTQWKVDVERWRAVRRLSRQYADPLSQAIALLPKKSERWCRLPTKSGYIPIRIVRDHLDAIDIQTPARVYTKTISPTLLCSLITGTFFKCYRPRPITYVNSIYTEYLFAHAVPYIAHSLIAQDASREPIDQNILSSEVHLKTLEIFLGDPSVSVGDRLRVACQIAKALHLMHEAGVCHNDLRPGNIYMKKPMASAPWSPRIGGFYMSAFQGRVTRPQDEKTDLILDYDEETDLVMDYEGEADHIPHRDKTSGPSLPYTAPVPYYMAPEAFTPETTILPSRDVFSFGAILYQLMSQTRLVAEGHWQKFECYIIPFQKMLRSREGQPYGKIACLIADCIAFAPKERPTMKTVLERLNAIRSTMKEDEMSTGVGK